MDAVLSAGTDLCSSTPEAPGLPRSLPSVLVRVAQNRFFSWVCSFTIDSMLYGFLDK